MKSAAVDQSFLAHYREMADEAFVLSLIEQFLNESAASLAAIDTAIANANAAALGAAAHALKGSSATIGATGLAAICSAIETLSRDGAFDRASHLAVALAGEHRSVRRELQEIAGTPPLAGRDAHA